MSRAFVSLWQQAMNDIPGCVRMDPYGTQALTRSLAIHAERRNEGIGGRLLHEAEQAVREHGVKHAYLLTLMAEAFFRHRGYSRMDRTEAPSAIASSTEFASMCPTSAVLKMKRP